MQPRLRYVPQLDGLRALAAIAVVIHHIPTQLGVGGYIGVDVFFVLSGFLITSLLRSEVTETGAVALREFYVRRLRRLTPALVLCALVVVQAYLVIEIAPDKSETALGGLLAATYTGSWAKALGFSSLGWLAHTWSLSVEEHFYLVWPVAVRWFARKSVDALFAATAGLFLLSAGLWTLGHARGWSVERLVFAPDTRAKDILAGCLLALALERGVLSRRPSPALGVGALGALAGWMLLVPKESAMYLAGWPLVLAASMCLVWVLVTNDASRLSRGLSLSGLVWLGKRSYGIYLWHYPVTILNAAVVGWGAPSRALVAVSTTTVAIGLAAWSYRYVEEPLRTQAYGPLSLQPLRNYIHHMFRRRRSILTSSAVNTSGSNTPSWSRRSTYPSAPALSTTNPLAQRPSKR